MVINVGKSKMINVRLNEKTHEEFKIAAQLRGASMSTLLHQFVVSTIREEKEREPQAFAPKVKSTNGQTKDQIKSDYGLGNAEIVGFPVYPELEEAKPKKKKTG